MLNPFPLQFLSLFAYFLLRVVIGFTFLLLSYRHFKDQESLTTPLKKLFLLPGKLNVLSLALIELLVGLSFLAGFLVQVASLISLTLTIIIILRYKKIFPAALPSRLTYFLLLGITLSLFVTGAGVFAFDLPI